ncbi:MAG TPA: hypothetical protein VGR57_21390 [Ktedonobacterales bacterium]|nr:hypothetical protein [Ktedonobacterales bacterium]
MSGNWNQEPQRGGLGRFLGNPVWTGIGGIVAILTLCVAALALPQSAPIRAGISQAISGTPAPTTPPTTTPLPTATPLPPRVITENLHIPCVFCAYSYDIVLDTISLDAEKQKMFWKFTITNTAADGASGTFDTFYLEDPATRQYTASGQALEQFNVAAGAPDDVTATFNFYPQAGVTYKLVLRINNNETYQDEVFTF